MQPALRLPAQPPLANGACRRLRCFSAGGVTVGACNLWVLIVYLFFLPVMLPSVLPRLGTDLAVRVFPGIWKPLFLRLPSRDGSPSLPILSLFLSVSFFPTSFRRQWADFLGVLYNLCAFRSSFVEFTPHSNVLLMKFWGRKWSPFPIPPPS